MYIADMKAIQCGDTFRQLLVGCRTETKSTVVAITKRVQFAISRHNGTVLEAARHLSEQWPYVYQYVYTHATYISTFMTRGFVLRIGAYHTA